MLSCLPTRTPSTLCVCSLHHVNWRCATHTAFFKWIEFGLALECHYWTWCFSSSLFGRLFAPHLGCSCPIVGISVGSVVFVHTQQSFRWLGRNCRSIIFSLLSLLVIFLFSFYALSLEEREEEVPVLSPSLETFALWHGHSCSPSKLRRRRICW